MTAPTLQLTVDQSSNPQPYQPVSITLGHARNTLTDAAEWTQSPSVTTETYFNGDITTLSSNTEYNVRAHEGNIKLKPGTLGSLNPGEYAIGDNDSLGSDHLYIRLSDSTAPADDEVLIYWDESIPGDSGGMAGMTIEWWFDLSDPDTVAGLEGWEDWARYITDHRTGETVDKAGSPPTANQGSPMVGLGWMGFLPEGSFKINCRATNAGVEQGLGSVTVVVPAYSRNEVTVGSGGTYATMVALAAASSGLAENTKATVLAGHTETVTGNHLFQCTGMWVEFETGCQITQNGSFRNRNSYVTWSGDVVADSDNSNTSFVEHWRVPMFGIHGVRLTGNSSSKLENIVKIVNTSSTTVLNGILLQSCTVDILETYTLAGNMADAGIIDVHYHGNDFYGDLTLDANGPSTNESTIRDVIHTDSQTIIYNGIREMSKDGLRNSEADGSYIAYNDALNGVFRPGESGSDNDKAKDTRMDGNRFRRSSLTSGLGTVNLKPGVDTAYIGNNVFSEDDASGAEAFGGASSPGTAVSPFLGYQEHTGIRFAHNTIEKTAGDQSLLTGSGGSDSTYVSDSSFRANHILTHASYAGTAIVANGFTSADNTVETGSLNSDLTASVEPTSIATEPGFYLDYFGRVRGATSFRGATGSSSESLERSGANNNNNMAGINHPRQSDTESRKTLAAGDSQFQPSPIRLWGALKDLEDWKTNGIAFGFQQNQTIGVELINKAGSITNLEAETRNLQDAMDIDSASGVMSSIGLEIQYNANVSDTTLVAIPELKGNVTWDGGNFDTDEEIVAAFLIRDHAAAERIRFSASRNQVTNAPIIDKYSGDFNNDDEFQVVELVIPSRADFPGAPAANLDVGGAVWTNFGNEQDHDNHLANVMHRRNGTAGTTDFASTGHTFSVIQQSGWSATQWLAGVDRGLLRGEIKMQRGISTFFIMFGHNADASVADHKAAIEGIIDAVNEDHDTLGYDRPHFIIITPWAVIDQTVSDRIESYGEAHKQISNARDNVGHISLFEFYDGQIPDGVLAGADGVFHEFNLDASLVHPADYDTASLFLQAIDWNLQEANFDSSSSATRKLGGTMNIRKYKRSMLKRRG